MSTPKQYFRISQIESMSDKDLSNDDLFLVSDKNTSARNNAYQSKKLRYADLKTAISRDISAVISPKITEDVKRQVEADIPELIGNAIECIDGGNAKSTK